MGLYPIPKDLAIDAENLIYSKLERKVLPSSKKQTKNVLILDIGEKSRESLGWPVPRETLVQVLRKLQESGNPPILSTIWVSKLLGKENEHQNFLDAIKTYGKFVGSSIQFKPDTEPTYFQEETLLPKILLTNASSIPDDLPLFELSFEESDDTVEAQYAYGNGRIFGNESRVFCLRSYVEGESDQVRLSVPSSFGWAASLLLSRPLTTHKGDKPMGHKSNLSISNPGLALPPKLCLRQTQVATQSYLKQHNVETIELSDFLEFSSRTNLNNTVVLLAMSEQAKKFSGPGTNKDSIVREPVLLARFVYDYVNGLTVDYYPKRFADPTFKALIILTLLASILVAFRGNIGFGFLLSFLASLLVWAYNFYSLNYLNLRISFFDLYLSSHIHLVFFGVLLVTKRLYHLRKRISFAERAKITLASPNNISELEKAITTTLEKDFRLKSLTFKNAQKDLIRVVDSGKGVSDFELDNSRQEDLGHIFKVKNRRVFLEKEFCSETERLGSIQFELQFQPIDQDLMKDIVEDLIKEVNLCWQRIILRYRQQLQSLKVVEEQSRSSILGHFLPNSLIDRFESGSLDTQLKEVLSPKPKKVAILQADVRGFSKMAAELEAIEVIDILQKLFEPVVEQAQIVAQVKLIGDCIFLFVEDNLSEKSKNNASPSDYALNIAMQLVRAINFCQQELNKQHKNIDLHFGIAMHFGECIVGNLSARNCIDYTVIGTEVNKTARIEEVTKMEKIQALVGKNAILLTKEAKENLSLFPHKLTQPLDLKKLQVRVRSFEHEDVIIDYITESQARKALEKYDDLKNWQKS